MDSHDLRKTLDQFASDNNVKAVQSYYIRGEFHVKTGDAEWYSDEAHDYCKACAETLLAKVLPHLPEGERKEHEIYPSTIESEDTCKHCITCGELLDYGLINIFPALMKDGDFRASH